MKYKGYTIIFALGKYWIWNDNLNRAVDSTYTHKGAIMLIDGWEA